MMASVVAIIIATINTQTLAAGVSAGDQTDAAWEACVYHSPWNGAVDWSAARSEVRQMAREIVRSCVHERFAYIASAGEHKARKLEVRLIKYMFAMLREDQRMRHCEDC